MTSWTVARQALLSVGFPRQEYWSGLSFPPPGDLPDPGIEPVSPMSPTLQADFLPAEPLGKPWTYTKNSISTFPRHVNLEGQKYGSRKEELFQVREKPRAQE